MKSFYDWLKANGFLYSRGNYHYDGQGWWYPELPDVSREQVHPPAGPWIRVFPSSIEQGGRTKETVDILTSFSAPQYNLESPEAAQEAVEHALMNMDEALGLEPLPVPTEYPEYLPPPNPAVRARIAAERAASRARVEVEWQRREGPGIRERDRMRAGEEARRSLNIPYVIPQDPHEYIPPKRTTAHANPVLSPEAKHEELVARRRAKKGKGPSYAGYDSDVSQSCDQGHHERCAGGFVCDCSCHQFNRPVARCDCGKSFTDAVWKELPLVGATTHGGEFVEVRTCSGCKGEVVR